jgi:hypothetical protein
VTVRYDQRHEAYGVLIGYKNAFFGFLVKQIFNKIFSVIFIRVVKRKSKYVATDAIKLHLPHIFSVFINRHKVFIIRIIFRTSHFNIAVFLRRQIIVIVLAIRGRWFLHVIITINIY